MSKTILVTGSQGYIGSVLVPRLEEEGYKVIGYDTGFFAESKLFEFFEPTYVKGDMRNFDYSLLDNIHAVVHLASIANDPFGNLSPQKIYDPITVYSYNLAAECKKRKIQFIWPSSCSVYGIGEGILDEESSLNPQTPYSKNKVEFEIELEKLSDDEFTPIVLRLCTLYGLSPRIRFDLVINMFAGMAYTDRKITLNSDGRSWRPLVNIIDVVSVITKCIDGSLLLERHTNRQKPLILNVGNNSDNHQIIELAEITGRIAGNTEIKFINYSGSKKSDKNFADQNIRDGVDVRTYRVSFDKLGEFIPSFEPLLTIEKGIEQMVSKFQQINLTHEEFINYKFYRLKTMDYLYQNEKINDDLIWIS